MLTRQSGFSLVETMIAVVVFSILLASSVSSYRTWIQNGQIRTAASSVLNGIQLAREEAASRNTLVSFSLNGNDWSVDALADPAYGVQAKNVQKKYGNEGSKNALITAGQTIITFNGSGRITPTPAAPITFSVTNPSAGACSSVRCMNVVVTSSGSARMCDPALSLADNPQGC